MSSPTNGAGDHGDEQPKQNSNTVLPIERLLETERFPTSIIGRLLLAVYLPIGLIIFVLRLAIAFHVFILSCLTRKASVFRCTVIRFMCCILGVVIREEGQPDESTKLIVTNHISVVDHSAIELIRPCVLPSVWDLPPLLTWALGYADLGALSGRDVLIENAKRFIANDDLPLLAFPEGALTNGRVGLLKFSSWPFTLDTAVQPALITAHRPVPLNIQLTCMGSRWWADLLWLLFCPMTVFTIRWLPALKKQAADSPEQFAAQVQLAIAHAAGFNATQHTNRDVVEYAKRRLIEERELQAQAQRQQQQRQRQQARAQHVSRNVQSTIELDRMTLKVKEIIPQAPLHVIRQDMEMTRSVDETTNNLTDGRVVFSEPEPISAMKISANDVASWSNLFEARKWAMIEESRSAYIKEHKLDAFGHPISS